MGQYNTFPRLVGAIQKGYQTEWCDSPFFYSTVYHETDTKQSERLPLLLVLEKEQQDRRSVCKGSANEVYRGYLRILQ